MRIHGIDFTSAPRRAKPIVVASGECDGRSLHLDRVERLEDFAAFAAWLLRSGPWVAGFDLPFSLSRQLVQDLGWPDTWPALMAHYASLSRESIRACFRAYCAARPTGSKFAHRACDGPAGASPSMKWVNPPVAWMLHAGVPRLIAADLTLPGLRKGDERRVGLEAYPGYVARRIVGRASYKSDDPAKQDAARRAARRRIVAALASPVGELARLPPATLSAALARQAIADASGDTLDAALCAVQAAFGWRERRRGWGLPRDVDPLEGWIVGVPRA